MKKKCTICGKKTEDWEIVNGGPVRCWECGKEIREAEKKEADHESIRAVSNGNR